MSHATVVLDEPRLARNLQAIRGQLGETSRLMLVVKAEAYGHGLDAVVACATRQGVRDFCVTHCGEAERVSRIAPDANIYVLGVMTAGEVEQARRHDWIAMVVSAEHAAVLAGVEGTARLRVHLKVDTGMGRLGVMWDEAARVAGQISSMAGLNLCGLATHFAAAGEEGGIDPALQLQRYRETLQAFEEAGLEPGMLHAANSDAFLHVDGADFDGVRIGLAAYGVAAGPRLILEPCMTWKTGVIQVRRLSAGATVGYGSEYAADEETLLAVCDVGYADGYRRSFGNCAQVLIHGVRCPVIGRVSMNFITVNVSSVPTCRAGDDVILLGESGDDTMSAQELAGHAGTIAYDILTGIRACVYESETA